MYGGILVFDMQLRSITDYAGISQQVVSSSP
jgi:hypothetical protein